MRLHRVEVGGTTLAVRAWGERGTPLLAWHALGQATSGAFLEIAADALSAHGLHAYAIDAPGFGRSVPLTLERYSVEQIADLLVGTAVELGLERPLLLGHSWGAAVVLEAARREPARFAGVVLLDAGHANYSDWPSAKPEASVQELIEDARAGDEIASSWDELARELASEYPGRDDWIMEFYREGARTAPDGRVTAGASADVRGAALHGLIRARPSAAWPVLQAASMPALFVLATVPDATDETNRRFVPALVAAWPDAEIVHVAGATHSLFPEMGSSLGDLVGAWAERQEIA